MKRVILFKSIFFIYTFMYPAIFLATDVLGPGPCTENDDCQNAIFIPLVISDHSYVCIPGCNLYASPDSVIAACQMGDFPTVWYRLTLDNNAVAVNIEVYSKDFNSPVISVFNASAGCGSLEQVFLSSSNLACIIGSDGVAKAIGTPVDSAFTYYVAISSLFSVGGDFELCISAQSTGFVCVLDRNIEITARSNAGPLEGPFDPNEKVSFCMNVYEYTAAGNGCQWFQGIVPVFGNGWDFSSFDSLGQPENATINGYAIGDSSNGLYGATTWNWFNDVGYHFDHASFNISDLDGNGRIEMCNSIYEVDCPHKGINGGCCGPCWEDQGDILPPGWFAYGINGTCAESGPPIKVDWGDGNTCGGGMGPWSFCFDLTTRDVPDCLGDSTKRELSLGFFTFADGETGSWTGDASVCSYDLPAKLSLQAKCGRVTTGDVEQLPPLCSGDILNYEIAEPGITYWEWNISPFWAVPYFENSGENGFGIAAPLINTSGQPVDISGTLIGRINGSEDIYLRKFKFKLNDTETCAFVSENSPHEPYGDSSGKIRIYPMPADESALLEWSFELHKEAFVEIHNSRGVLIENFSIATHDGNQKQITTSGLLPGIYFITMGNADFRYITKLVKL